MCGRLSHVIASTSSGICVASMFVVGAFFLIGAMSDVIALGLIGIPVAVYYNVWAWKRADLWPISGASSKLSRRGGFFVNILALLGVFFS
jgi:uncharacterized membrane protein YphA (DoxX/SURF4 family)